MIRGLPPTDSVSPTAPSEDIKSWLTNHCLAVDHNRLYIRLSCGNKFGINIGIRRRIDDHQIRPLAGLQGPDQAAPFDNRSRSRCHHCDKITVG